MQLPGAEPPTDQLLVLPGVPLAQPGFLQGQRLFADLRRQRELPLGLHPREDAHLRGIGPVVGVHDARSLEGCPAGRSVAADDPWRVVFRWIEGTGHEIQLLDYHKG